MDKIELECYILIDGFVFRREEQPRVVGRDLQDARKKDHASSAAKLPAGSGCYALLVSAHVRQARSVGQEALQGNH